jgi:hypothetical protein
LGAGVLEQVAGAPPAVGEAVEVLGAAADRDKLVELEQSGGA